MLETFVDPSRFVGTIYQAANWELVGETKGYQRSRSGYSTTRQTPKLVFVQSLQRNGRMLLSRPLLPKLYLTGGTRMKLTAEQMRSLPDFFSQIADPRRAQGRKHRVHVVLTLAAGCFMWNTRLQSDIRLDTGLISQSS